MRNAVQAACDAHINRAMPAIRQRVANMRFRKLNPRQWCVVVATLDPANPFGVTFARRLSPWFVPVGKGQGFETLIQVDDAVEGIGESGGPPQLVQQVEQAAANVPAGSVLVLCSVSEGVAATVIPFADKDLPPPNPNANPPVTTPSGRRRRGLMGAHLETIARCYAQMVKEGLDPGDYSVIVLDPNANAMGLRLLEEVEADGTRVARTKAEAERGEAGPYVNFAKNDQLGPFMQNLKIEVDGSVRDAAITAPGRADLLRVVVCTGNGATVFDVPRPRRVTAPRVPQA